MDKKQALSLLLLLSNVENLILAKAQLNDHLYEELDNAVAALKAIVLGGES